MSGKGLAFLNKKGWHVGTIHNQERVWKAEQDAAAEKKKLGEIRKQIEEERRIMELQQVKDSALPGHKKTARLEWMYQGMAAWAQASTDEYLKGKPIADKPGEGEDNKTLGLYRNRGITPQQDAWAKLRDDPLLEIRKQAQEQIAHLKKNPIQMEKIKQQLMEQAKAAGGASSSSSLARKPSSDSRREHSPLRRERERERSPQRRRSPSPRRSRDDKPPASSSSSSRSHTSASTSSSRHRSRSRSPDHHRRRSRSPPRRDRSHSHASKRNDISQEERERRLAAMMNDAETHHEARFERLKTEAAEKEKEEKDMPNPEKLNFLNDVNKSVYDAKAASVEDRLQRNRHFRQNANALEETGIATRV